jgi:hypothetical protein
MGWATQLRAELRAAGRLDLEKAVTASGGFPEVAKELGWKLAYKSKKPRGYWDDLNNMRREIEVRFNVHVPSGQLRLSLVRRSVDSRGCSLGVDR